jgi:very-short-patch-repair endonuclease
MKSKTRRGEVLVAILKAKSDYAILLEQGWYRIPVTKAPRSWPPKWLAFYQPNAFGEDAYRVRYFGEIDNIELAKRDELFPNEISSVKSNQVYYKIWLKSLEERYEPIPSYRPRRLVFIPTTWNKFRGAEQINDLFDDSPLENRLWQELKKLEIDAERQWGVRPKQRFYQLDFAIFCNQGLIDVETDGDSWHARSERIPQDNQRNNELASQGWHVLRFNGNQIHEEKAKYCLENIQDMVNRLGGLDTDGIVPRVFYSDSGKNTQQFTLFEVAERDYLIEAVE